MSFPVLWPRSLGEQGTWPGARELAAHLGLRSHRSNTADSTSLPVMFLNKRQENQLCLAQLTPSGGACLGGHGEEIWVALSPASMSTQLPCPSIHALSLLKRSWSSWEQSPVWDCIQFVAALFLRN